MNNSWFQKGEAKIQPQRHPINQPASAGGWTNLERNGNDMSAAPLHATQGHLYIPFHLRVDLPLCGLWEAALLWI